MLVLQFKGQHSPECRLKDQLRQEPLLPRLILDSYGLYSELTD